MTQDDIADLERFDIDLDDPSAEESLGVARFLEEKGEPLESIRAAKTIRDLGFKAWTYALGVRSVKRSAATNGEELPEELVERVTRALGFREEIATEFEENGEDFLGLFIAAIDLLGEQQTIQLARVIGSSLERIAEAVAATIRVNVEGPMRTQSSYADFIRFAEGIAESMLPGLALILDRVHRYKLLGSAEQAWSLNPEASAATMELTVGFADMVGFTSRSGRTSTGELASVIDDFEIRVSDEIAKSGGRAVKFIGDEVMFVFFDPERACDCARRLVALTVDDDDIPDVRVGIAFGDVLTRYGDYYGPVVNLASRLTETAPPGGVLVTAELAEKAPSFAFSEQAPTPLKGVEQTVTPLRLA